MKNRKQTNMKIILEASGKTVIWIMGMLFALIALLAIAFLYFNSDKSFTVTKKNDVEVSLK
jgi:hypothetical protein